MRLSSVRCYQQIKEEKLLGKMQLAVYEALGEHGPGTAGELHRAMMESGQWKQSLNRNIVCSRLSELREQKVAREEPDMRTCRVSGRMCLVWAIADGLPVKPVDKKNSKQRIKELQDQLEASEARCRNLEAVNSHLKAKGQLSLI